MKQLKKLLAGLLTAALLVSLVPAAVATPAEEDLLDVLERLYGTSVSLLDADDGTEPVYGGNQVDADRAAQVTVGDAVSEEDGTVKVPVYVTAPAGLNGVQMKVTPGAGLKYTGQDNDGSFTVAEVRDGDTLTLVFGSADNVTLTDGLLTTLIFEVDSAVELDSVIPVTGTADLVTYRWDDEANNTYYTMVYGTADTADGAVTVPTRAIVTLGNNDLTACAGGTVTVPVSIRTNCESGVNGIQMTIVYDDSVLSINAWDGTDAVTLLSGDADYSVDQTTDDARFVGDADTAKVKSIVNTDDGELNLLLMWANDENIKLDGQIAALTFTVKDELGENETETTISGEIADVTYEDSTTPFNHYSATQVEPCTIALGGTPSANINVTVTNNTGATPAATFAAPEGGWVEGENTFTVSADVACVVAVKNDDGTYTRLTATATDVEGTYSFTAELTEGSEIAVVIKGDVNGDGEVNNFDAAIAKSVSLDKVTLEGINVLAGDVNGDGKVDNFDATIVKSVSLAKVTLSW